MKYVRLLSGTMIPKDVKDIVGVAAMFSGHIFRSQEEFSSYIDSLAGSDAAQIDKKRIGLRQVRERFKDNIALIRIKRKEWAFLLPSPIESFIPVFISRVEDRRYRLDDEHGRSLSPLPGDNDPNFIPEDPDEAIEKVHRLIYEEVLKSEAENLEEAEKKKPKKEGGDDGDEDDDDEFEKLSVGKYNFQRIDRITMDPESDEIYGKPAIANLRIAYKEKYGKALDTENFVPRKIREVIKRLDLHFDIPEWKDGSNLQGSW